jgi:putative RNA 2'-phosphotransferase
MNDKRLVKTSKYLSRHLRHDPGRLGLTLEPGGWVHIDALLAACRTQSFALAIADLPQVVERNDKRRFSFDETGTRIRANQGHSVEVDLELEPANPPAVLFHGTGLRHLDSILRAGLTRAGRHHVHLSTDTATATRVGARHGRPVVLEVAAARMRQDGFSFYVTANGVWLTKAVPIAYLSLRSKVRWAGAR